MCKLGISVPAVRKSLIRGDMAKKEKVNLRIKKSNMHLTIAARCLS